MAAVDGIQRQRLAPVKVMGEISGGVHRNHDTSGQQGHEEALFRFTHPTHQHYDRTVLQQVGSSAEEGLYAARPHPVTKLATWKLHGPPEAPEQQRGVPDDAHTHTGKSGCYYLERQSLLAAHLIPCCDQPEILIYGTVHEKLAYHVCIFKVIKMIHFEIATSPER